MVSVQDSSGHGSDHEVSFHSETSIEICARGLRQLSAELPSTMTLFESGSYAPNSYHELQLLAEQFYTVGKALYALLTTYTTGREGFGDIRKIFDQERKNYLQQKQNFLNKDPKFSAQFEADLQARSSLYEAHENLTDLVQSADAVQLAAGCDAVHLWLASIVSLRILYDKRVRDYKRTGQIQLAEAEQANVSAELRSYFSEIVAAFEHGYKSENIRLQTLADGLEKKIHTLVEKFGVYQAGEDFNFSVDEVPNVLVSVPEKLISIWVENSLSNAWKAYSSMEENEDSSNKFSFDVHLSFEIDNNAHKLIVRLKDNGAGVKTKKTFAFGVGGYAENNGKKQESNAMGMAVLARTVQENYGGALYLEPNPDLDGWGAISVLELPLG